MFTKCLTDMKAENGRMALSAHGKSWAMAWRADEKGLFCHAGGKYGEQPVPKWMGERIGLTAERISFPAGCILPCDDIGEKLPGSCQDTSGAAFHVALAVKICLAMCLIFAESECDLVGHAFIILVETAVGDLAGAHT